MQTTGPNDRLRQAMAAANLTIEQLAEQVGYHPKQVGRWLELGQVPRRAGATARIADLLGRDEADIWPTTTPARGNGTGSTELVNAWAHRADASPDRWWRLLTSAEHQIDLLAAAMLFLPEQHPGLVDMLAEKASAGVRVRIALGDPDGPEVAARAAEERLPLVERVRYSLRYLGPAADVDGIEVRLWNAPLYASVFRADDQAFWTPHLYALPGPLAPLIHVRADSSTGIHASLVAHVDRIWETATPWPGPTTTTTPTPLTQTR